MKSCIGNRQQNKLCIWVTEKKKKEAAHESRCMCIRKRGGLSPGIMRRELLCENVMSVCAIVCVCVCHTRAQALEAHSYLSANLTHWLFPKHSITFSYSKPSRLLTLIRRIQDQLYQNHTRKWGCLLFSDSSKPNIFYLRAEDLGEPGPGPGYLPHAHAGWALAQSSPRQAGSSLSSNLGCPGHCK